MDSKDIFRQYLTRKGLKSTRQRDIILDAFLKTTAHVSTEDLYLGLRSDHPNIGYATVYRTLKLFKESGIAEERNFGDGQTRYEVSGGDEHHDHLICTVCGAIIEFEDPRIEELQEKVAAERNFTIHSHRLEIHGICSKCSESQHVGI